MPAGPPPMTATLWPVAGRDLGGSTLRTERPSTEASME